MIEIPCNSCNKLSSHLYLELGQSRLYGRCPEHKLDPQTVEAARMYIVELTEEQVVEIYIADIMES
jgi:hypothetical protein